MIVGLPFKPKNRRPRSIPGSERNPCRSTELRPELDRNRSDVSVGDEIAAFDKATTRRFAASDRLGTEIDHAASPQLNGHASTSTLGLQVSVEMKERQGLLIHFKRALTRWWVEVFAIAHHVGNSQFVDGAVERR